MHASAHRPEEDTESPRTAVTDGSETPCGSWEQNLGSLKNQQVHNN